MINRGNGFASLHPGICFAYFVILILFSMLFNHPFYLVSILISALLLNILLDGGEMLKKNSRFYLFMTAVIIVFNPIFSSRGATILFYFRERPVTLESISHGVLFAVSLLCILVAFLAYNKVVTSDRFLFLFSPLAPKTAFIINVSLRFIPLLKRRMQEVMIVQQVMDAFNGNKSKRQKAKDALEVLNILVTWSLEATMQTAASMRARGYERGQRSSVVDYSVKRRDVYWLVFMFLTGSAALLGFFWGYGQFAVYPRISEPGSFFTWHGLMLLLFLFIPIYIEGRELVQWRFMRSRM